MSEINGAEAAGAVRTAREGRQDERTADADMKTRRPRPQVIEENPEEMNLGDNVLIVDPAHHEAAINRVVTAPEEAEEATAG